MKNNSFNKRITFINILFFILLIVFNIGSLYHKWLHFISAFFTITATLLIVWINIKYRAKEKAFDIANYEAEKKQKEMLLTSISHELRSPLNIMQGMTEMILHDSDDETINYYANSANEAGYILNTRLNNLLDYSTMESGQLAQRDSEFSFYEILSIYNKYINLRMKRRNIGISIILDTPLPCYLIGNRALYNQFIYNIIASFVNTYSIDNMDLRLSWTTLDAQSFENIFQKKAVASNGYIFGHITYLINCPDKLISEEQLIKTKESAGSDSKSSNNIDTSKLGSLLLGQFIEKLNANVFVTTDDIYGTSVRFDIPFCARPDFFSNFDETEANAMAQKGEIHFTAENARILSVDDSDTNNILIKQLLKDSKATVDTASGGQEALKLIRSNNYDLLLIDYMMPHMNGIELLQEIRRQFPFYEEIPAIIVSANVSSINMQPFIDAGFKTYISKPIEKAFLDKIVENNLPKHLISYEYLANTRTMSENAEMYGNILEKYDISISEGLKYMNDNLSQYAFVAELITKEYIKNKNRIEAYYAAGDIKNFGICVHALKGNAKYVGAKSLFELCYTIEKKSYINDTDYIELALPLFMYIWKNTIEGLLEFLKCYTEPDSDNETDEYQDLTKYNFLDKLIEYADLYQPEPAIKLINHSINTFSLDEDTTDKLRQAIGCLEELEYDDAIEIFRNIHSKEYM